MQTQACCNCSIPSWAKWGNLWVHPCLGCCHLPVTQSFQWVKLLDRTFHVGLSCAQFCSSNDSIISNDQILDDSQRPLPSVFVSVLMITTSPKAGVSLPAPHCARCLSRRLRRYSLVHRLHTASLHFSKCFAHFRRSVVSMWCGCNSGSKLLFKNNIAFSVRRGICTSSST